MRTKTKYKYNKSGSKEAILKAKILESAFGIDFLKSVLAFFMRKPLPSWQNMTRIDFPPFLRVNWIRMDANIMILK